MEHTQSGMFITFEGIDGAGKTSQICLLKEWLESHSKKVTLFKGNDELDDIKSRIINNSETIDPILIYLLTMTKHRVLMNDIINELKNVDVVILDRYIDTSFAYTGANVSSMYYESIQLINKEFSKLFLQPQLTILLKTSPEVALSRKKNMGYFDRIELGHAKLTTPDEGFILNQTKALENYIKVANEQQNRFVVIDGELNKDEIHQKICDVVLKNLRK